MNNTLSEKTYREKVVSCWLGKAIGGTLGLPFEGHEGPLNVTYYNPVPQSVLPNDDLDLQVVWACVMDRLPITRVDRHDLGRAWLEHVDFPFDEYGVAIRNLREGLHPPITGSYDNWFTCGMGAAIRSEIWACLAPGNPVLAAKYAYEDACVDHDGDGIWAEVFLAALESQAFIESDTQALFDVALAQLPAESSIYKAVKDTATWWRASGDWKAVRRQILDRYEHENFTDVTMNLAFTVLAWLASAGDFGQAICIATNCGKDTDCTAATVGSLMGILNPDSIDDKWLKPIGRELVLSKEIVGIQPPKTIDELADLVIDLRRRLGNQPTIGSSKGIDAESAGSPIPIEAGFLDALPDVDSELPTLAAGSMRLNMPGTVGSWSTSEFDGPALLVRYRFNLPKRQDVRVMFNVHEATRVWIDGNYTFGRDGGKLDPSFHRRPQDQWRDLSLGQGPHELVAAIQKPAKDVSRIEWVIGVADAKTLQWIPNAFVTRSAEVVTSSSR